MNIVLILPNQLFENNELVNNNSIVYIYEHPVFFTMYKYHKLKLILHRSTMKSYYDYLSQKYSCKIKYLDYAYDIEKIFKKYHDKKIDMYDPVDFYCIEHLKKICKKYNNELFLHDSPLFIATLPDLKEYEELTKGKHLHQTSFYIWQRKRLNILVDKNEKPIGGKWTFDKENRLPYSNKIIDNYKFKINGNNYVNEAVKYINKNFPDNPGETNLYLPIDFKGAKQHLNNFIRQRLNCFGPYQDAVGKDLIFGCHSVLSPLMNIGLLTHKFVISQIIEYYEKHKSTTKLASIEGIIRQILGWANFTRYVYMFKHKELIKSNHFNHKRKLGKEWYTGQTGIEPIDDIINKVLKYGYAHHIERLMYLGNFMLLCKFNPKDVHDWFQSMFIDSYHVFMETNVYGMSQYSCGPLMTTRPYFSSSNYIDKMSSYKKKKNIYHKINIDENEYEWFEIWDALYYNFINDNQKELSSNYSTASSVTHWKNKTSKEKQKLLNIAKKYLAKY